MVFRSLRRVSLAVLAAAALAAPVLGQARSVSGLEKDYIFPSPSKVARVKVLGGKRSGPGERVSYQSFSGKAYEQTRYHGTYVDVLFPDAWMQGTTEDQRRRFVDLSDLVYQHLLELVGTPPSGDGPLEISIVPDACGGALGCAGVGTKGIEMLEDPRSDVYAWEEIDLDVPSPILVHEMCHNFDVFSDYLGYTTDRFHAWTDFLSYYFFPYAREGHSVASPEEVTEEWLTATSRYFREPTADWESCVAEDRCEDRFITSELAWGGFAFRLALLDGSQAVQGFTAFLAQYKQTHEPPQTAEEKNDLFLEAWASGAHRNLSCVVDTWHWQASDALRDRMHQLYGDQNPDCQDLDHDGFSLLQGDCNDRRATVHPGAPERTPRVDDDCDGLVDETPVQVTAGGGIDDPRRIPLPAEITASPRDSLGDAYVFHLKSPSRVRFEVCTAPNEWWSLFFRPDQLALSTPFGGCIAQAFPLGAGDQRFYVSKGESSAYSVTVQPVGPWPAPPWARTAPPRQQGGRFLLTARAALPHLARPGAQVRFWVSGQGFVGTAPYSPGASFAWTPPAGVDPAGLFYRAQLVEGGAPAYEITPPQPFAGP